MIAGDTGAWVVARVAIDGGDGRGVTCACGVLEDEGLFARSPNNA